MHVKEMSQLISRIRYRQFGVQVTTSFVDSQAYREVVEDGHPILIITVTDIARILRNNVINSYNIEDWLESIDNENTKRRLLAYHAKMKDHKLQFIE